MVTLLGVLLYMYKYRAKTYRMRTSENEYTCNIKDMNYNLLDDCFKRLHLGNVWVWCVRKFKTSWVSFSANSWKTYV